MPEIADDEKLRERIYELLLENSRLRWALWLGFAPNRKFFEGCGFEWWKDIAYPALSKKP